MTKRSTRVIFIKSKKPFNVDDIDVSKILISKKERYGEKNSIKFFIGYSYNDGIRSLCIKLLQIFGYAKYFNSIKTVSFEANDNKLLKSILQYGKELLL